MTVSTQKYFIVSPRANTNLVKNPSFEVGTTGWSATGFTFVRSSTYSRRGVWSGKITDASIAGTEYIASTTTDIAVTVGSQYTLTMDVKKVTATGTGSMRIHWFTAASAYISASEKIFNSGTHDWIRYTLTATAPATAAFASIIFYNTGLTVGSALEAYFDGVQFELAATASTFIDGDNKETINGIRQYGWNGTAHASTSYRLASTRSGGTLVDIETYAKIINVDGLGIGPVENTSIQLTNGTERHQASYVKSRYFTMSLVFEGASIGAIAAKRLALTNLIKPDLVIGNQLITLMYEGYNSSGVIDSETVEIKCEYVDGFSRASQRMYKEFTDLTFRMPDAYMQKYGDSSAVLGFQTSVSNLGYVGKRSADGTWSALQTGLNDVVFKLLEGANGYIYAIGVFTDAGGSGANYIAQYDPASNTWGKLVATQPNAPIYDATLDAAGNIIIVGGFTAVDGTAYARIAKITPAGVVSGFGTGLNAEGRGVEVDSAGRVWVVGDFTTANGVTVNRVTYWNGTTFVAIGTGANDWIYDIAIDQSDNCYIAGWFTAVNGITSNYFAKVNTSGFTTLGDFDAKPIKVDVDNNGNVYTAGSMTTIGAYSVPNGVAIWDGIKWFDAGLVATGNFSGIVFDKVTNKVYIGGDFTAINGISTVDAFVEYISVGSFRPLDIALPSSPTEVYSLLTSRTGSFYCAFNATGTGTSATVTAGSVATANSYPVITIAGQGTLWQIKNYTTGKALYFKNFTLLAGEVVTIDLRPGKITAESTFRGSVLSYILKGSNYDFELAPGSNNVSAYLYGSTTAASGITMTWRDNYHGIDGAQR
jgi:hypothetical protein